MMSAALQDWVGRREAATDVVSPRQARQMAATLGVDGLALDDGCALPPLWHWLGWLPETPAAGLGPDGHPARGGFLPPVPLERRMWAGGRLTFHAPLRIGAALQRHSEIVMVSEKTGSTGRMVFVTVSHRMHDAGTLAVTEEQDIVYVAMPERFAPPPPVIAAPEPLWTEAAAIDTVLLFRFSALTFNAHRIHFDLPYATGVEKYPGLVVHGPLQALLLMSAACRLRGMAQPARFRFRGVRPLFHFDPMRLVGWPEAAGAQALATVLPDGMTCMQAEIGWQA